MLSEWKVFSSPFFSALYNDLSVWLLWGSFHFWKWLDLKCATNNITAAQKAAIFRCVFCNLNHLVWLQYNKKKPISWFCDFHFFIWHINLCFSYLYFCFDWILLAYSLKQIFLVWFIFLFKHVLVFYCNQWWPASLLYLLFNILFCCFLVSGKGFCPLNGGLLFDPVDYAHDMCHSKYMITEFMSWNAPPVPRCFGFRRMEFRQKVISTNINPWCMCLLGW